MAKTQHKLNDVGSLEVIRWNFELIDGHPKIVIHCIKVLDKNGKYIKFAKLEKIAPYLNKFPIKFNPLG